MTTHAKLLDLLAEPPADPDFAAGYLNLLGDEVQAGPPTGLVQRLMRTNLVPMVYERWWRPALGRVIKGPSGPSMAEEHDIAVRLLRLEPGGVALDVACGTGGFTRRFGAEVGPSGLAVGLDASAPMLERAVAATAAGSPVVYLRADAVRPPLRESVVDAVCCFAALHMFAEPTVALTSFARVLKPGGRLALLTSARESWEPARTVQTAMGWASGQRMFARDEVRDLLTERGFTDIEVRFAGATQFVGATAT
ncbi:class I SAM-dependent methyltransferase [Actinokineospora sp.]|uniref:class I SAM-dependent methyltransferase n=1 Tax=Actinokineospora sp. TaxID=1872133 RepID=UPI003D6A9331